MTQSLTGKVALVTGAAKGIGAGIAKAMAAEQGRPSPNQALHLTGAASMVSRDTALCSGPGR